MTDPERKGFPRMCWEFLRCSIARKCLAFHYLSSFLYRRDVNNIFDYLSEREAREIQDRINDRRVADLVSNKLQFAEHFQRGGFPVPQLLGYNLREKMYLNQRGAWDFAELRSEQILQDRLTSLMACWGMDQIFVKPIRGSQGAGAFKITRDQLSIPAHLHRLSSAFRGHSYVLQEVVRQHPDLSKLNPRSLNTMRIDTFLADGKTPKILSAFLRIGGSECDVDNVSSGGVFAGINLENGRLKPIARNFFHGSQGCRTFTKNPANGIVLDGYQIPLFDDVKRLITQAAAFLPPALAGWDVAVGPSGPVLIECNVLYYGVISSEIAYGGYRRNPVWQEVVAYAREKRFR